MHYESTAFSSNGLPTIVPKQANVVLRNAAFKTSITATDSLEINTWYKCNLTG